MWDFSPWELFLRGGPVMWPLLACSILGLALILDRGLALFTRHKSFPRFVERLEPLGRSGQWDKMVQRAQGTSPYDWIVRTFAVQRQRPSAERLDILQREGSLALAPLETRLRWLSMLGQLAPMLGLLGTVTGLVEAFHQVERLGGQVQPSDLASGIWEALLTTIFGLVIALPCLTAHHFFEGRIEALSVNMGHLVSYLQEWEAASHAEAPADVILPA
jgi:biopolymer transport protein ExbB